MLLRESLNNQLPQALSRMRENTLFSGYDEHDLQQLARFSRLERQPPGKLLFRAGESCEAFYFVHSGLIKLFCDGIKPNEQKIMEFVDAGHTFAEGALFSGQGYSANAMTLDYSELVRIEAVRFSRFISARPQLCWRMLGGVSNRLHQLVGQIASLSLHNAEQKVAAYLLQHIDGEEEPLRVRPLPSRRRELASRLNLRVETLCRVLSNFRRAGWIHTEGSSRIHILEPLALQAVLEPRSSNA